MFFYKIQTVLNEEHYFNCMIQNFFGHVSFSYHFMPMKAKRFTYTYMLNPEVIGVKNCLLLNTSEFRWQNGRRSFISKMNDSLHLLRH